jgi:pyruvate dehydrogenase E2 component (dihydrolipoamide acetyltransferase)
MPMSSIRAITMPKWGIEMQEGTITGWTATVGQTLSVGDPLLDVETDKIVNSVESPFAGTLRRIVADAGAAYAVGALLAVLADASVSDGDIEAFVAAFKPAQTSFEPGGDAVAPAPAPTAAAPAAAAPAAAAGESSDGEGRVSPIARRLAQKLGIDLSQIKGTGPNGRISKEDVEKVAAAQSGAAPAPAPVAAPAPSPAAMPAAPDVPTSTAVPTNTAGVYRERLTPMRQTIGRHLLASTQSIPHYRLERTVELSALLAYRERLNAEGRVRVSVNDCLLRAVALNLLEHPMVNAHLVGDELLRFASADVAFAVATPTGLLTPVVRSAHALSVAEIATRVRDLAGRARSGKLVREEIEGATFTVSNLGMYGLDRFDAIINPPQVAILAVGAVREAPIVRDGALAVGHVCTLTLSADHRVIDGAVGAGFLATLADRLAQPTTL